MKFNIKKKWKELTKLSDDVIIAREPFTSPNEPPVYAGYKTTKLGGQIRVTPYSYFKPLIKKLDRKGIKIRNKEGMIQDFKEVEARRKRFLKEETKEYVIK